MYLEIKRKRLNHLRYYKKKQQQKTRDNCGQDGRWGGGQGDGAKGETNIQEKEKN
jgi:hypothetical protein